MPVSYQPLSWELTHKPRCGLCSFFPINHVGRYPCPIGQRFVTRTTKPLRKRGFGGKNYICFHPMSEFAFERLNDYWGRRLDQQDRDSADRKKPPPGFRRKPPQTAEEKSAYQREKRRLDPIPHREEVKRWRKNNPDKVEAARIRYNEKNKERLAIKHKKIYEENKEAIKERTKFRSYIEWYNPLAPILKRFAYARRVERDGPKKRTPEEQARRRRVKINVLIESSPKTLVTPSTETIPEFTLTPVDAIPLDKPRSSKKPKSKKRQLWQTHPDHYRAQSLKFKRPDMQ